MPEPLSVESLHQAAKVLDGLDGNLGTTVNAVLEAVSDPGQCSEQAWPYGSQRPELDEEDFYKAGHRTAASDGLISTIRTHIAASRMVVVCLQVTEAWWRPSSDGWIKPDSKDAQLGGHAVVAVAYDLPTEAVLVRNSWGRSWARDGYAWLPDDYLMVQVSAWFALDPIEPS